MRPPPVLAAPVPVARPLLYVDTSALNPSQKAVVTAAIASWEVQTHGCVTIREGDGIRIVQMPDENDYPWWVVGMYIPEDHKIEVKFQYSDPMLVVLHEIGHALGMSHVSGKLSMMYRAPCVSTMSVEDLIELSRVTRCRFSGI